MNRYNLFSLMASIFLTVLLGSIFFFQQPSVENESETRDAGKGVDALSERKYWSASIDAIGAKQAYTEFIADYKYRHFNDQHLAAHIMGELLYQTEGINGITICDDSFAFGCYHSFYGQAIAENGIDAIRQLDEICIRKYGPLGVGCQHGIGHGLIEYLGPERLIAALEACATLYWQQPLFGCQSGVFMEYNFPVAIDNVSAVLTQREADHDNLYEPCQSIPLRFRQACYFELSQWWEKFISYTRIGELCGALLNNDEREACFFGVGHVASPSSEYDVVRTIEKCQMMPVFEGELLCRAGSSWSFFAKPDQRIFAPKLCEGLSDHHHERCVRASDLVGTKSGVLP